MASTDELDNLRVVLVSTRNPLNIGAAARAMSNFGVSHLRVVNPYEPAFREARSAVGAASLLKKAEQYEGVAEAVADCTLVVGTSALHNRDPEQPVRPLQEGARLIRKRLASSRVAILFGSEKFGLSKRDLDHCHWLMRIPTREQHASMNLGQAVAVCMYELARAAKTSQRVEKDPPAKSAELERITSLLFDVLGASDYIKPGSVPVIEDKMRRMVRRMQLSAHDATLWLGILRQIGWKLGARGPKK